MDKDTGRVSPQFHVKFDVRFQTTLQDTTPTNWQVATGFTQKTRDSSPIAKPHDPKSGANKVNKASRRRDNTERTTTSSNNKRNRMQKSEGESNVPKSSRTTYDKTPKGNR